MLLMYAGIALGFGLAGRFAFEYDNGVLALVAILFVVLFLAVDKFDMRRFRR